uniref:Gustatory receptor n=1 Tax=Strigamia maritima TaxID=126957 RepID=T1J811_STRMM
MFDNVCKLLFVYICYVLSLHFQSLKRRTRQIEIKDSFTLYKTMRNLHKDYDQLSNWTDQVSRGFSPILAFWIAGDVASICFSCRALKSEFSLTNSFLPYGAHDMWILALIFMFGAEIYTQKPQQRCKCSCRQLKPQLCQMLFMQELALGEVGIDVNGIFVLSRTSILTVVGTILTYIVVLYQTP